jgi:tRNA pseudouridine55 synthase
LIPQALNYKALISCVPTSKAGIMRHGVLNINKPMGMTSHDVVAKVRRIAGQKKVGHAGTLDPDATGVLLVCLGNATRLSDLLAAEGKSYEAVLALGAATSTEDKSGEILSRSDASHITEDDLLAAIPKFVGEIQQIPPMVSAVHYNGQRLYELARQGIVVEREARTIRIDSIKLIEFIADGESPKARLAVECGKGTYIRTLCADIGAELAVGGYMESLTRTSVGEFKLGDQYSVTLEALAESGVDARLCSPSKAIGKMPTRCVPPSEIEDLFNGKNLPVNDGNNEPGSLIKLVHDESGDLLAIGKVDETGALIHPEKVFPSDSLDRYRAP